MAELADTSAWAARNLSTAVHEEFERLLAADQIATCEQVAIELLFSAQDAAEFDQRRAELGALRQCPVSLVVWERAFEVFRMLAGQGPLHHRQVKPADLVIAAAAENAGVGVLHSPRRAPHRQTTRPG